MPLSALLAAILSGAVASDSLQTQVAVDAIVALRHFNTIPSTEKENVYYLTLSGVPKKDRAGLLTAIRMMVASTSLQPVLERCSPETITESIFAINLRDLQWSKEAWAKSLKSYPYIPFRESKAPRGSPPRIIRADWFLLRLCDASISSTYYDLLFGETPAKRDEWLQKLGVDRKADPYLRLGMIEGESGVAVNSVRWLESFPSLRGYAWGTKDSLVLSSDKDPLEAPDGSFQHDGEEWIVSIPKVSTTTGKRGSLQVYLLSDGKGNRVDKAPVNLVEDSTRFRNRAEIVNPGSCVQCHDKGLRYPTKNELKANLIDGLALYAKDPEDRNRLEAFHFSDLERNLTRANEDFETAVSLVTGFPPEETAEAVRKAILQYDADLTLDQAALELGVSPVTARIAIASQTQSAVPIPARIASLAHSGKISRAAFEEHYTTLLKYLKEARR